MCGIAGKVYRDARRPVEREALVRMNTTLAHRGPDDAGYHVDGNAGIAMRRLSIIDVAAGRQPIHNETKTVWTVFNGEIYNFRELHRDLEAAGHRFSTRSDTEVIVHLYEQYGVDFVAHLNGMFGIAVWDAARRQLVLARDRLGIKPLFYAALPDRLLFGSEIKAVIADGLRPTVDLDAVSQYLSLLYVPAPLTIYREVRKLPPGHLLVWRDGAVTTHRYWDLGTVAPRRPTPREMPDVDAELRALMTDAVRRQLVSDVPLGAFLSGGLDSSTVVALMRQAHNGPIRTFSIGFGDPSYDELPWARLVARRFGTEHTELMVTPSASDLLPQLADHFDEPFADSSAVPTWYLSKLTREHVTVALGGDGGDELFAGYVTYQADRLAGLYDRLPGVLTRRVVPGIVDRLPVSDGKVSFDFKARRFVANALHAPERRHYAWKAFFDDALKHAVLAGDVRRALDGRLDAFPVFERHYDRVRHRDRLDAFLYVDTSVYLPDDILVKVDRMSMAHSLEARVPLLDHRLAEFLFALPAAVKMPGLRLKTLLKRAMRGTLPDAILNKRKGGFNAPVPRWLKGELAPHVHHYLGADRIRAGGVFDPATVSRLVADHQAGRADYSRNLWALLTFAVWQERAPVNQVPGNGAAVARTGPKEAAAR